MISMDAAFRRHKPMRQDMNMGNALDYLLELIEAGWEYPDAEYKAARKFGVPADELRACYDNR
jgi:hypothetical protein